MHTKPKRYQNQRCLHFITFSCFQRRPLLDSIDAREIFERELERVRQWYGCYVTGYVVMPDHVHTAGNNLERCRPYGRPTLPHKTREEWGNQIYDPDER